MRVLHGKAQPLHAVLSFLYLGLCSTQLSLPIIMPCDGTELHCCERTSKLDAQGIKSLERIVQYRQDEMAMTA